MISLLLVPPSDTPTTDRACGDVGRHSTGWRSRFSSTAVMRFKYPPSKMTLDTAKKNLGKLRGFQLVGNPRKKAPRGRIQRTVQQYPAGSRFLLQME